MYRAGMTFFGFALILLTVGAMPSETPVREIDVHAQRYAFEPSSITVHRGETIRLRLVSGDVPHSLVIHALGIDLAATKSHPGEDVFTANAPGDYAGRCGRFCGSGHGHMTFTIHVSQN